MTLIFVEQVTNRLRYTLDFIFNARGLGYELTTDITHFTAANATKFNYSNRSFEGTPTLTPCTLLFDEGIDAIALDKVDFEELEIMSFNQIPDLLASIFFVLSRYEEYWVSERDAHDRFPAVCSMQSVYGWLHEPICDRWAITLLTWIGIPLTPSAEFKIQPTFDIDSTFAYKEKGLLRNMAGAIRDVSKGRIARVRERIQVLSNRRKDPFDTFDRIKTLTANYPDTRCFWLMADYGSYNKNLAFNNSKQREIIQEIATRCEIGIHPGYDSYTSAKTLNLEISRLSAVLEKPVTSSRQHFLRVRIPETYALLVEQGIQEDYSMGYAETTGFRMGTARKTAWFNLRTNEITGLMLQPFCYMDGTLNEYLKLSPELASQEVRELKAKVNQYGGTFSFIWHNETLGFKQHWAGWEPVFEESISYS
jgi:hypothetical protein